MLHLDLDRILYLLISEELEARDLGNLLDRVVVVVLVEALLILKSHDRLVLHPVIYLITTFATCEAILMIWSVP